MSTRGETNEWYFFGLLFWRTFSIRRVANGDSRRMNGGLATLILVISGCNISEWRLWLTCATDNFAMGNWGNLLGNYAGLFLINRLSLKASGLVILLHIFSLTWVKDWENEIVHGTVQKTCAVQQWRIQDNFKFAYFFHFLFSASFTFFFQFLSPCGLSVQIVLQPTLWLWVNNNEIKFYYAGFWFHTGANPTAEKRNGDQVAKKKKREDNRYSKRRFKPLPLHKFGSEHRATPTLKAWVRLDTFCSQHRCHCHYWYPCSRSFFWKIVIWFWFKSCLYRLSVLTFFEPRLWDTTHL